MSGGSFNYEQHHLSMLVGEIKENLESAENYSPLLLGEMLDCIHNLEILELKLHHIDYALSGDTDQSDYLERLNRDLLEYYDKHDTKANRKETDNPT